MSAADLDATDRRILMLLQRDGSLALAEIAAAVGLTTSPCWKRIRRLEDAGVIRGRVAVVDPAKVGLPLTAFVEIEAGDHSPEWLARFAEAVGEKGRMTETWLSVKDQPIFAWAGLWTNSDEWGSVYTGVMTEACLELEHIHDRSPVILDPQDWDTWLNAPLADLYQFDRPLPVERMVVNATDKLWFTGR